MIARSLRRAFVIFAVVGSLVLVRASAALCQSCCVLPNQATVTPTGSEHDTTWVGGDFVQEISNSQYPSQNYDNHTVQEINGATGTNGCYFPGSEIGQHPQIFGPGGTQWTVGSSNQWGPDFIGYHTIDAQQIYQQEQAGAVPNGCDTVTYQTMQINCNAVFQTYLSNLEQDRFVYSNQTMKACRVDVSPGNCWGSIPIPPT